MANINLNPLLTHEANIVQVFVKFEVLWTVTTYWNNICITLSQIHSDKISATFLWFPIVSLLKF